MTRMKLIQEFSEPCVEGLEPGAGVPVLVEDEEGGFKAHQAQAGSLELLHLIPAAKSSL